MKAYSHDLRVRIFNYSLTHSVRETARVFQVSPNTVYLLKKLFIETGSLEPRESQREIPHLITPEGELSISLWISEDNDLTLEELCDRYEQDYGIRVSITTMHNTLKQLNITRKKKTFSDPNKDSEHARIEKEAYDSKLQEIAPEKRFYLDETGSCLTMAPLYGRSLKGRRAYDQKPTYSSATVSTVAILTDHGIEAQYTYRGSLTADEFIRYLESTVSPILTNGQTLIMDRHPVHRAKAVQRYLKKHHINFLYLPPYSPELNPIEEAFSKIKQFIKKQKARTVEALFKVIDKAFDILSIKDINGYFRHAYEFSM